MNRRNFIRNSFVLGALAGISNSLWAGTGRSAQILLPAAPLHIRHGLLQAASIAQPISQCRWLLGLSQNNFLRNGLETQEIPFRHFDLQLAGNRIGIGLQGENGWICGAESTEAFRFPAHKTLDGYHFIFEQLSAGHSYSPSENCAEWLCMPLSGTVWVDGQKLENNQLFFTKNPMITLFSSDAARFMLLGREC